MSDDAPKMVEDGPSEAGGHHGSVHEKSIGTRNWFTTYCFVWQVAMIVLYGTCTFYEDDMMPDGAPGPETQLEVKYAMFQDTHVMMILGFGFLYTLLRRYAWSGVTYNYIITVLSLQWSLLCLGFWRRVDAKAHNSNSGSGFPSIPLTIHSLIDADYIAATVLISFGALLGRLSATQAVLMTFTEVIAITGNVAIAGRLGVTDAGGSMVIHVFGAAFGLAFAKAFGDAPGKGKGNGEAALGTSRHNGTFAMIGTAFLFCFWPSFNAALLSGAAQHRAVVNTVLSICASVVAACASSMAIHGGRRLDMEHVQNATLAGGVAIGAACDMLLNPWGAIFTGAVAGTLSAYGFSFVGPWLKGKAGITDVCGIASLHLMPGLMGGTAAAIAAAGMTGSHWTDAAVAGTFPMMPARADRSALIQGCYQFAMLVISFFLACFTGYCTGWVLGHPACASWTEPMTGCYYEDAGVWVVPPHEEEDPVAAAAAAVGVAVAHTGKAEQHAVAVSTGVALLQTKGTTTTSRIPGPASGLVAHPEGGLALRQPVAVAAALPEGDAAIPAAAPVEIELVTR